MQISARILGQEYGVTGAEMNRILVKLGFLKGQPGNYSITEKAMKYAIEKDFHRGTGGYAQYNRYWTTRTFDESIKNALDITPQIIQEVRKEMADERAVRCAIQAAERAKANSDFLAKQAAERAIVEATELAARAKMDTVKKAGLAGTVIICVFAGGYGVYKLAYKIKARKAQKSQLKEECEDANILSKKELGLQIDEPLSFSAN